MYILAGDIGGTNTRLICAELKDGNKTIIGESNYLCADYQSFDQLLKQFHNDTNINHPIESACFSVAGPVKPGVVAVTNLPWVISASDLKDKFSIKSLKLINDFTAIAYGIPQLEEKDLIILQQGSNEGLSAIKNDAVIIGAGTGLGACHLVEQDGDYVVYPSEAGHVNFSPQNYQQVDILNWLWQTQDYVSLENLLSGKGIVTIYHYLKSVEKMKEESSIQKQFKSNDPAKVITENAMNNSCQLCKQTVEMFINIYGSAASNILLHHYPVTQLYIAGGIVNKIKGIMNNGQFIDAFNNKGLMQKNMQNVTVKLICQEKIGLYGALSQC